LRAKHTAISAEAGTKPVSILGTVFAYALAKELDEPLLFKGDDFRRTDIEAAV
jgi:ribonuclease VapC